MSDDATPTADRREHHRFRLSRVARDAKAGMVRGVFDSVASRDLMNDLMSVASIASGNASR